MTDYNDATLDALEAEAQRPEPRRERIAALNQRVSELQEVNDG